MAVTWEEIAKLFRPGDIECMRHHGVNLAYCPSVKGHAMQILQRVSSDVGATNHMPPGEKWSQAQIDLFAAWVHEGSPCPASNES